MGLIVFSGAVAWCWIIFSLFSVFVKCHWWKDYMPSSMGCLFWVHSVFWEKLTHWGRVTHTCVSILTIIGSDNGLSPGRCQAIIWTSAGILLIQTLGTNFNEILNEIYPFSLKKMHLTMLCVKWRLFCLCLNELTLSCWPYIVCALCDDIMFGSKKSVQEKDW